MKSINLPAKLKQDAIVEAIVEIRFDMTTIPEIFFGRLAEYSPWIGFEQRRMAAYEIPAPIRQADINLRFAPVFELVDASTRRSIRIGPHVLSVHCLAPYVGWGKFNQDLDEAVQALFLKTKDLTIRRMGLRYLNALLPTIHGIDTIADLDLRLTIAGVEVAKSVNINFTTELSETTQCTVRIATPDFVQGVLPRRTTVLIDVDVMTKEVFHAKTTNEVNAWIEFAHTKEKEQFFRLLTDQTIDALKEA